MQTEIVSTDDPCPRCGMARRFFLRDTGLTTEGYHYVAYRSETPKHSVNECDRFLTLQREQWPTLW